MIPTVSRSVLLKWNLCTLILRYPRSFKSLQHLIRHNMITTRNNLSLDAWQCTTPFLTRNFHQLPICLTKEDIINSSINLTDIQKRMCHDKSNLPKISEDDLEEHFTRGHGPGGQSVNKTTNCCVLKHKPTGLTVKVHETRSLQENRKLARLRLRQKIDLVVNKDQSQRELARKEASLKRQDKKKKTNERLAKLRAFKEREGL